MPLPAALISPAVAGSTGRHATLLLMMADDDRLLWPRDAHGGAC